jgi:hypothetical protein
MNKGTLTRRDFLRLTALGGAGLLVARCAPQLTPTPTTPSPTASVGVPVTAVPEGVRNAYGYVEWHPDELVELNFWGQDLTDVSGPGAAANRTEIGFRTMYPTIGVHEIPGTSWAGGMTPEDKMAAVYAAGTDTPDLFLNLGNSDISVGNGWALPVTEELMPVEDRQRLGYKELRLLQTRGDDSVTELAALVMGPVLFYRVDDFEEVGITPADLGEYFEDAIPALKELTKVDEHGTILRAGFRLRPLHWLELPIQAGSTWFNTETRRFEWSTDDAVLYACQFYRDLYQTHRICSMEIPEPYQAIPDNLTATAMDYSWVERFLRMARTDVTTVRARNILRLRGGDKKGYWGTNSSMGISISTLLQDPLKLRAAQEFWKYCYYNTSNQADLGIENNQVVFLNNPPDYGSSVAGLPETGALERAQDRRAEVQYTATQKIGLTWGTSRIRRATSIPRCPKRLLGRTGPCVRSWRSSRPKPKPIGMRISGTYLAWERNVMLDTINR